MGWQDATVNGIPVVGHNGDVVTFHTDMILVPSTGWGVELIADSSSLPTSLSLSIDSTAKGVVLMLAGKTPAFTLSPLGTYIIFDLLLLVLAGFQGWSLVRILRNPTQPARAGRIWILRRLIAPLAWRLAVASAAIVVVFVVLGGSIGASPLLIAETDLGTSAIAISALLLINDGMRTGRAYRSLVSQGHVAATVSATAALREAVG